LLGDLFAVVEEFDSAHGEPLPGGLGGTAVAVATVIDRDKVERAFDFACERHADQKRYSGDEFITHPVGVAQICAGMRLDTETLCAALLHDTVEDTSASLEEIQAEFGDEIAQLVDGVTKLTGMNFESRDERQAENYRKMMVAMATDVRVILIKLADRLHNMRTLGALPKQKQTLKSHETLEIYAPLAHRLGIHAIKWELEDLAFATLHPRKYAEIKQLVAQQRDERENYVTEAGEFLSEELEEVGIVAEISGRAKHFYSIYTKMAKKGREFNEIFDLTAMRVIVGSVKDCYGAVGVIHSLWKPLPGRFKDFVAMPKANMYQALHTTVIGPEGKPLEIQIRTEEMHKLAEYGIAAHVAYKEGSHGDPQREKMTWLRQLVEAEGEQDPAEFLESLKVDLFEDEVFVFTPKGEVKSLSAGSTPLDFAYAVHTDVGHSCVGAKVNGAIVPLHYQLRSGDIVEVLTAKQKRAPSLDWLKLVRTSRARNKIRAWFKEERREDAERDGREGLEEALKKRGVPMQKISGSALLADVIREMGFRKASEFYIALGQGKISTKTAVKKILQRLKSGESVDDGDLLPATEHSDRARRTKDASNYGIVVKGVENVAVRLAKCCRPVPGDNIAGYVSLGRGITIHRTDCKNVKALKRAPERFVDVGWEGENEASYRVEIQIDAYDRTRLLEDLSRTFSEGGINIIGAACTTNHPMVKNKFVVEVGDTEQLKHCITRLRNVESVFDAYRITPTA
jgi:GTP pyrophosphokinase